MKSENTTCYTINDYLLLISFFPEYRTASLTSSLGSVMIQWKRSLGLLHWAAYPALICLIGSKFWSKNTSPSSQSTSTIWDSPCPTHNIALVSQQSLGRRHCTPRVPVYHRTCTETHETDLWLLGVWKPKLNVCSLSSQHTANLGINTNNWIIACRENSKENCSGYWETAPINSNAGVEIVLALSINNIEDPWFLWQKVVMTNLMGTLLISKPGWNCAITA